MSDRPGRDAEFTAFVNAQSAPLVHFARLLCGDVHLAEDLVQSALEKVYSRWHRIELQDPRAYVRRSIVNQYLSRQRRAPWREQPTEDLHLSSGSTVADPAQAAVDRHFLLRALATLTPRERTVIVLRYHHDLTERATAEELGLAVGTIKSTTSLAMAKLRVSPELVDHHDRSQS